MTGGGHRGLLLDRDGTVIEDAGYLHDPAQVRLLPGAVEGLAQLVREGFRPAVVSNQSGVARGLVTPAEAAAVHRRFVEVLAEAGVSLAGAYYCFHGPGDGCDCRKPAPGLLLRAAGALGLEPARCVMVGDKVSDVEAGARAGCRTVWLGWGRDYPVDGPPPDARAAGWAEVVAACRELTAQGGG